MRAALGCNDGSTDRQTAYPEYGRQPCAIGRALACGQRPRLFHAEDRETEGRAAGRAGEDEQWRLRTEDVRQRTGGRRGNAATRRAHSGTAVGARRQILPARLRHIARRAPDVALGGNRHPRLRCGRRRGIPRIRSYAGILLGLALLLNHHRSSPAPLLLSAKLQRHNADAPLRFMTVSGFLR